MQPRRILVTGASGALGHSISGALQARGHQVRGFDCVEPHREGDHRLGDILDVDALYAAALGIDVIVHFAAVPDHDEFTNKLVPTNVVGTYNVFEVARMRGIQRVIYASSCRVLSSLDWKSETLTLEAGLQPGDHYGVTKATGELLGRVYATQFGITVLCARVGWFVRNRAEAEAMGKSEVGQRMYLSHRDAADFFGRAVSVELPSFAAVFVTSQNAGRPIGDPEPALTVVGYRGVDTWPEGSDWQESPVFQSPHGDSSLLRDRSSKV